MEREGGKEKDGERREGVGRERREREEFVAATEEEGIERWTGCGKRKREREGKAKGGNGEKGKEL